MIGKRQDDSVAPTTTTAPIVGLLSGVTTISGSITTTWTMETQTNSPISIQSSIVSTTPVAQPFSTSLITNPTNPSIVHDFLSNKGAVAGVFTGLASLVLLLCSVLTMAWRRRRRNQKRQEAFEERGNRRKQEKPTQDEDESVLEIKAIEGGFLRHLSNISLNRIPRSFHAPSVPKGVNDDEEEEDDDDGHSPRRGRGRGRGERPKTKRESEVVFASGPDNILMRSYDNHPFSSPSARSSISHSQTTTNAHAATTAAATAGPPSLVVVPAFMSALPQPTPLSASTPNPFPLANDEDSILMTIPIILPSDPLMDGTNTDGVMTTKPKSLRSSLKGKGKGKGRARGWRRRSYTSTSSWISGYGNNNNNTNQDYKRDSKASKHRSTNTTTTSGTNHSNHTKNTTTGTTTTSTDKRSSGEREWWWTRRRRRADGHNVMDDWDMFRDPREEEEERRKRKEEKRKRREEKKKKEEEKKKLWNEPMGMMMMMMNNHLEDGLKKDGGSVNSWYDDDEKRGSPSFLHVEYRQPTVSDSEQRFGSSLGTGGAIWVIGDKLLAVDDEILMQGKEETGEQDASNGGDQHIFKEGPHSRSKRLGSLPVLPLLPFQGGDLATAKATGDGSDSSRKEESLPQDGDQNQRSRVNMVGVSKDGKMRRSKQRQTSPKQREISGALQENSTMPIPRDSVPRVTNGTTPTPYNSPPDNEQLVLADVFAHPYSRPYNGIYSSHTPSSSISSSRIIDSTRVSVERETKDRREKHRDHGRLAQETSTSLPFDSTLHQHRSQISASTPNFPRSLPTSYSGLRTSSALEQTHRTGTMQTEQKLRAVSPSANLISSSVVPDMPNVMAPHNGRRHPYAAQS